MSDWPGLDGRALFEGRDLKPTMQLDAFIGGAVAGHFGTDPARTMMTLFPNTTGAPVVQGLLRA